MSDFAILIFSIIILAMFFGGFYLFFRIVRNAIRSNKKRKEDFEIRKIEAETKAAEIAKSQLREKELIAEVEASQAKAEAAERAMRAAAQEREDTEATLKMSTVTVDGRTMSLKDAIAQQTVNMFSQKVNNTISSNIANDSVSRIKCSQCGASIESGSKFCRFCGTQVPDNTFRAEVKFEDVAQLRQAELEHARKSKLLYRLTEVQKALTQEHEVRMEQLKTKVEEKKIKAEEKAEQRAAEERERKRQQQIEIEKARLASRRATQSFLKFLLISLAIILVLLFVLSRISN